LIPPPPPSTLFPYTTLFRSDRSALKKAVKQAYDQVGNIDILINNAGYTNPVPLQQVKMSDFEKTMEVNLYGPFTIVKTLLNRGKDRKSTRLNSSHVSISYAV